MIQDPELRRALIERVRYYRELGIYDFYRREPINASATPLLEEAPLRESASEHREEMPRKSAVLAKPVESDPLPVLTVHPEQNVADTVAALRLIREDLGDCTRCKLHQQGRKQIVFGVGNPRADLMFVGEGPGADEDTQGEPFVDRAGQLLNTMIKAMGLRREDVYIANIIKCRPPGNRTPERDECETCSPFLMRQIATIKPKAIVALGAVAAKTLLAINAPMSQLLVHWYEFSATNLAVPANRAFLLRDRRQQTAAWKGRQTV